MAVTKILSKKMRLDKLINYVINPDKTDDYVLTYFYNCYREDAAKQMKETKKRFSKTDGIQAFHIIQAFNPGEVSPELALEIANSFIKEHLHGFEVVLGTHVDKGHVHSHIVFNSVSFMDGHKYHSTAKSYFREIRVISDRLCREYGLSVIMETSGKALSYAEWKLRQAGVYSLRELFELDFNECLANSYDLGSFYALMEAKGYEIVHNSKYPSFKPKEAKHGFRAKHSGKSVTEDELRELIMNGMLLDAEEVAVRPREYVPYKAYGKQHGFRALVVSWMYVLGIIGQGKRTDYKVNYAELKRLERYKRDEAFLQKHGIDTEEQLDSKEAAINSEIEKLTKTRIILNSKKKRKHRLYDALAAIEYYAQASELYSEGESGIAEEYKAYKNAEALLNGEDRESLQREKNELYEAIADVNRNLRELRSALKIISDIRTDIPHMDECLKQTDERNKEQEDYYRYYEEIK
ncbi:MAG: relaxase/mobilization nuclease domain-containing protein [Clostridia bacterium]|nr:relaxase/mobilization nuclease domain-containing protein [Clostridia bacterium]